MKISKLGLELIKLHEAFRSKPYLCPAKVPTIGYGSTFYEDGTKVKLSDAPISKEMATIIMSHYINEKIIPTIQRTVKIALTQNEIDSLCSFIYNLGETNFITSTLLKKINQNIKGAEIERQFLKWNKANVSGKLIPLKGLTKRRKQEYELFNSI